MESPILDANILLCAALDKSREWLIAHSDYRLGSNELRRFNSYIQERAARKPIAYIIGRKSFYGLEFKVTPATLIPRPETELLVELGFAFLLKRSNYPVRVADVGTGSGCIAITLTRLLQDSGVKAVLYASDTSPDALEIAKQNAVCHGVSDSIEFLQCNLLSCFEKKKNPLFDLILSNPPYISSKDILRLKPEVKSFEPHDALDGGADGLKVIKRLLPQVAARLQWDGRVLLEIGSGQMDSVADLADLAGLKLLKAHFDLAGIMRVLEFSHAAGRK